MSSKPPSLPVSVVAVNAVAVGVLAFRRSGQLSLSVVVKTTFALAPSGVVTPAPPAPLRFDDQHYDDDPTKSLREPRDLVPELRFADVIFAGHAYGPQGQPASQVTARLVVTAANGTALVNKPLDVLGNRLLRPGHDMPEPAPFDKIPLTYEHAYGGPEFGANPVGMGITPDLGGRRRLPNIVHPRRSPGAPVDPAGFGAISPRWSSRRRMLATTPNWTLDLPIATLPDSLDPRYFQAAPVDQQTPYLLGDEWIILEALNPQHRSLESRLPGARGVPLIYLPDGLTRPIPLVADRLFIDGDALTCSVSWRGRFPLPSEADLPRTAIAGALEWPRRPVAWPNNIPRAAPSLVAPPLPSPPLPAPPLPGPPLQAPPFTPPPPPPLGLSPPLPPRTSVPPPLPPARASVPPVAPPRPPSKTPGKP